MAAQNKNTATQPEKSFFAESVIELKKVTTPTKQETIQATLVTVVIMTFVAVCLMVLDSIFRVLTDAVLG